MGPLSIGNRHFRKVLVRFVVHVDFLHKHKKWSIPLLVYDGM